ncbi:hypothetical protein HPB50_028064 [Hyalomma asiaticum]|nr:hypothetical protein HPB50_028064 [Hyalomma asiaticum]
MRRLMKELGVSAECKHQFVKLPRKMAESLWKVQHSIAPCADRQANVNAMDQCQVCTTDNFVFPLLVLLLLKPVRSVCLSPQAAAEKPTSCTPAVTAAAGAIAAAVAVNARWASLTGNRSVAVEKVVGERAASIEVFKTIDIGP